MQHTPPLELSSSKESENAQEEPNTTTHNVQLVKDDPVPSPAPAPAPAPPPLTWNRERIVAGFDIIWSFCVLQALRIKMQMRRLRFGVLFKIVIALLTVVLGLFIAQSQTPPCSFPLTSTLSTCSQRRSPQPRFADLVDIQKRLTSTLDIADLGSELTLKSTELAVRDLSIMVKHSQLPRKVVLVEALRGFAGAADDAGVHMSELHDGIMRAIDKILSTNGDVIYSLEAVAQDEEAKGISAIINRLMGPPAMREDPMELFNELATSVETQLAKLVGMATTTTSSLNLVNRRLDRVREEVIKMDGKAKSGKEKLLSDVWTSAGGNKAELASYNRNIGILSRVDNTSAMAGQQVGSILIQLRRLRTDLARLREAVTESTVTNSKIGPEVYIKFLREGVEHVREKVELQEIKDRRIRKVMSSDSQNPEFGS